MEFFVYCRDVEGAATLRKQTTETHWAFMDRYAATMIARGPTLSEDGTSPTGSMHMLDLPDAEAALVFAYEEPFYKAGVFRDVMVRRWRNALGRTMWQFPGAPAEFRRFLVIGHGKPGASPARDRVTEAQQRYFTEHGYQERFIARGPLFSDDGAAWAGSAMVITLPSIEAVRTMLDAAPYNREGLYDRVEIFPWRPGGRH